MNSKIKSLSELERRLPPLKSKGKKIVLCHGVFDLMHPGHILYFQAAKRHGDILVVTITPDHLVNKGPNRPVYNQRLRLESIAALECVDFAALNEWPTAVNTILTLKPNIYAKGQDYANAATDVTGQIRNEMAAVKKVKGKTIFTHEEMFSSSALLNKFYSTFPPATQQYLNRFRKKHSLDEVLAYVHSLSDIKVLVVGEAILDQYFYCQPLGKSPKETIVASKFISEENFAGGSMAIANHLAGFCARVTLVSPMGLEPEIDKFFRSKLAKNIKLIPLKTPGRPTVIKRRYVEPTFLNKMFEIEYLEDAPLPRPIENQAIDILREQLYKHDMVVVADYGHGFLTERLRDEIIGIAKFLCVNTQTNSANLGFNPATNYRNVNYMAIDEPEMKLALRKKYGDFKGLAQDLYRQIKTDVLLVSRGPHGSFILPTENTIHETPVMSTRIVDRTGAGDALFAITSPCAYKKVPSDVIGFLGNCAGAMKVETVCNREPIGLAALSKFVTGILR